MAVNSGDTRKPRWQRIRVVVVVSLLVFQSGCATIGYYKQAVVGQMSLLARREPIDDVIRSPATPEDVRQKLELARDVRAFAETELGLDVDDTFSTYADLGRDYVLWNLFVAPPFSVKLKQFCYPIAGCVTYRGYFERNEALDKAAELIAEGWDVHVGGVAAYSTLGWFEDPILNTFMRRSNTRFAALLFHELAHKAVYVTGDTTFNESFATAFERAAVRRWLSEQGAFEEFLAYLDIEEKELEVVRLIQATRQRLRELYECDMAPADMAKAKQAVIEQMRSEYAALAGTDEEPYPFRVWMATPINNAKMGTVVEYNKWVPGFMEMFDNAGGDFGQFIEAVEELSDRDKDYRDTLLASLTATRRQS